MTTESKRKLIETHNKGISIMRQCQLIGLNRSTYYYKKRKQDFENAVLMKLLDEQYTKTPFYGILKMTAYLKSLGFNVNKKRVIRLLNLMGFETIYSKPKFRRTKSNNSNIFPYLLGKSEITKPDQVWASDITYIHMKRGWLYLVCIVDWYSRYVLSWDISNTMDSSFVIRALKNALKISTPDIFNSDQGTQFTSTDFIRVLKEKQVNISMVGKGRCWDNIFVERLWRTVKYEEVYLKDYSNALEARLNLSEYFRFYNEERLHQSLDYKTPTDFYFKEINCGEQKILAEKLLTKIV